MAGQTRSASGHTTAQRPSASLGSPSTDDQGVPVTAAAWDQWNAGALPRFPHEHVVRFVREGFSTPVAPGTRALDLGCGTGADTRYLMECGFDVTAVDRSPAAIASTQELTAGLPGTLDVQTTPLAEFAFPARAMSCVICVGLLDAVGRDEARRAVPRLVDSLRPGGRALLVLAAEGDSRVNASPELGLHGYTRREVEALVILEYGTGVWIDSCTTTIQSDARRQIDWLVTLVKR